MPASAAPPDLDYRSYPVLVLDDEPDLVRAFTFSYRRDFTILGATSPHEALALLQRETVAVVVSDQRMPEMSGVDFLKRALEIRPGIIPIILTGYTDAEALVRAINMGRIFRYVPKPWDRDEFREILRQAVETFHLLRTNAALVAENGRLVVELERANERLRRENRYLRTEQRDGEVAGFEAIAGRSPELLRVLDRARRVAATDSTVLIQGPTGTGKELLARAIHAAGPRADRLFVAVNAGAVPESLLPSTLFGHRKGAFTGASSDQQGLVQTADGGTLFLDEIGETSPAVQIHLLRVLQEGEVLPVGTTRPQRVDVRVIAATNRDLEADVRAGRFREDLLHRLAVFPLRMPSLRDRRDDIPLLAGHLLASQCRRLGRVDPGFHPDALAALQAHGFPGNVRELQNLIERALILAEPGRPIEVDDLFDRQPEGGEAGDGTLQREVTAFERERIAAAMARAGGNRTHAARELGLTYNGLLKKMRRVGMID